MSNVRADVTVYQGGVIVDLRSTTVSSGSDGWLLPSRDATIFLTVSVNMDDGAIMYFENVLVQDATTGIIGGVTADTLYGEVNCDQVKLDVKKLGSVPFSSFGFYDYYDNPVSGETDNYDGEMPSAFGVDPFNRVLLFKIDFDIANFPDLPSGEVGDIVLISAGYTGDC